MVDPYAHLYDGFHRCETCRFYASDPEVVAKHSLGCDGEAHEWCECCRFDCQTREELVTHIRSDDCVNELFEIFADQSIPRDERAPLYQLNYDVFDRTDK